MHLVRFEHNVSLSRDHVTVTVTVSTAGAVTVTATGAVAVTRFARVSRHPNHFHWKYPHFHLLRCQASFLSSTSILSDGSSLSGSIAGSGSGSGSGSLSGSGSGSGSGCNSGFNFSCTIC